MRFVDFEKLFRSLFRISAVQNVLERNQVECFLLRPHKLY